ENRESAWKMRALSFNFHSTNLPGRRRCGERVYAARHSISSGRTATSHWRILGATLGGCVIISKNAVTSSGRFRRWRIDGTLSSTQVSPASAVRASGNASASLTRQALGRSSGEQVFLFHVDFVRCRSTRKCREMVSTTCPCHIQLKEG